ncbi:MAG: nuclear transport factor 2 family protein [Oceanospirillaceae bacterium]
MYRVFLSRYLLLLTLLPAAFNAYAVNNQELTKAAVKVYYSALENHDIAKLGSYYAQDITYEDIATGEVIKGRDQALEYVKSFLESSPGLKVKATQVVFDADSASVEWVMSAGSGKDAWSVRGASVINHKNGLMTRVSDYWNN